MGFDLQFETEGSFLNDDRSWIRRREGYDDMQSITLDLTTFVLATHYPNGFIPSGIVLGKITATGLYGIYATGALDGRQAARGFLGAAVDMTAVPATNKSVSSLFWRGTVKETRLPANNGLDAAAKVDLGPTAVDALLVADGQFGQIRFE
jgi:hypothetical protein